MTREAHTQARPARDFQEHLERLDRAGLLMRIDRPVNKDTQLHPLVRWQFIGGVPEAERKDIQVVCEVRHGNPKEEVFRVAEEKNVDLIITGARGTGKLGTPWGSVSSAVVRNGNIPVLVVRALAS